jgi:hypothetical protein
MLPPALPCGAMDSVGFVRLYERDCCILGQWMTTGELIMAVFPTMLRD